MKLDALRRAAGSLLRRARVTDERQGRLFGEDGQTLIDEAPARGVALPADAAPTGTPTQVLPADAAATPTPGLPTEAAAEHRSALPAEAATVRDLALRTEAPDAAGPAYRHPRATRQLRLAGHDVAYAFVRARRRSIGMVVGPEGLSVRAPRWVSLREVEAALHERAVWIVEHLAGQRERAARAREHDAQWCDGGTLRVLGAPVKLVFDPSARGCVASWASPSGLGVPPAGATLRVNPPARRGATFRATVEAWLQAQAAALFAQRCAHYAPLLEVQVRRIGLSGARTRWGSAGVDGSIRLNWRLMHHPMDCVDYVVVHELAHLRHMNHGPAFWRLVESVIPEHRTLRRRLRDDAAGE